MLKHITRFFPTSHSSSPSNKENSSTINVSENSVSDKSERMAAFPDGHFYSPVVNPQEVKLIENSIWPPDPPDIPGIDFNIEKQKEFLLKDFPGIIADFQFPAKAEDVANPYDFYIENGQFGGLDARTLYVILRLFQPRNILEVGSGFSSLLTAHVNRKWFKSESNFTCIEPYPREFLVNGVPGINGLIRSKVQDVGLEIFEMLGDGDILFIDSSHVSKTGSDVNFLYFEVIPRLKPGVLIHIHDIFFPYDYPKGWVIRDCRSWNEQYLLQAMLMFTNAFEVVFGSAYAYYVFPELVKSVCQDFYEGGSFWLKKVSN